VSIYEKNVLPEYVEITPKLKPLLKKEDLPLEVPFGYIFVSVGQEELVDDIFIRDIPVSSSLKKIRLLFDKKLKRALFDYLSYRLGLELGKEDIAIRFRDRALDLNPKDYERIEKLDRDGKLSGIIFNECLIRLWKTSGKPSVSDVTEVSKLARKLADLDVVVVRVGEASPISYIEKVLEKRTGIILLARGRYINNAIDVALKLINERDLKLIPQKDLGFTNPEIETWHFIHPEKESESVSCMRIWLEKSGKKRVR